MDGDRFINTSKIFRNEHELAEDENNFFLQPETSVMPKIVQTEPIHHINDYDYNILQEDAYKDVNDEVFKLEYKIAKTEEELKSINKQIQIAEDMHDYYESEKLRARKTLLEKDLFVLTDLYKEAGISAKISGGFTSKIRDKFLNAGKAIESFGEAILSKMPGKISSIIEIKNSLNKLENINKSVDVLMKSRYPYGEAAEKYDQLSRYIARANSIQSEIYKFIK